MSLRFPKGGTSSNPFGFSQGVHASSVDAADVLPGNLVSGVKNSGGYAIAGDGESGLTFPLLGTNTLPMTLPFHISNMAASRPATPLPPTPGALYAPSSYFAKLPGVLKTVQVVFSTTDYTAADGTRTLAAWTGWTTGSFQLRIRQSIAGAAPTTIWTCDTPITKAIANAGVGNRCAEISYTGLSIAVPANAEIWMDASTDATWNGTALEAFASGMGYVDTT